MKIRLALLRHGHTSWNRLGRIQGRTDIPLDSEAERQLAALRLPQPWIAAELWSSPLARARRTAELVADRKPRTSPALTEMDWGAWEGAYGQHLIDDPQSDYRHIEAWGWNYTPPNGESPQTLKQRLLPWAQELRRDAVAVCHIGVMRVLLAHATGWNFSGPPPFAIKRNRLYVIEIEQNQYHFHRDPVRLEARI